MDKFPLADITNIPLHNLLYPDYPIKKCLNNPSGFGKVFISKCHNYDNLSKVIKQYNIHRIIALGHRWKKWYILNHFGINIQCIPVYDHDKSRNLLKFQRKLNKLCPLLDKYLHKGENILIHCARGISRSVTTLLYYLVWKALHTEPHIDMKTLINDRLRYISMWRKCANPHPGLINMCKNITI